MKSFLNMLAVKGADLRGRWRARQAGRVLRKSAANLTNRTGLIELAFQFDHHGIQVAPMQIRSELAGLLKFFEARPPELVLEIGTARGGTFFLLPCVASEDAQLITLDSPNAPFGVDSDPWRTNLLRSLGHAQRKIHVLRADPQREETLARVRKLLCGKALDLLFIDGDHRYEAVKTDFAIYAALFRKGGFITLHDIVPEKRDMWVVSQNSGVN